MRTFALLHSILKHIKEMKKLYIETYGCQMNVADSEVVASVMKMAGYDLCDNEADADAIFLNTCSVRENAENKIYHRLDMLHAEQKKGAACCSACWAAWLSASRTTS